MMMMMMMMIFLDYAKRTDNPCTLQIRPCGLSRGRPDLGQNGLDDAGDDDGGGGGDDDNDDDFPTVTERKCLVWHFSEEVLRDI